MKSKNSFFVFFLFCVFIITSVVSCNTTKYAALPCPDLPNNYPDKKYASRKIKKDKKIFAFNERKNNRKQNRRTIGLFAKNNRSTIATTKAINSETNNTLAAEDNIEYPNNVDYAENTVISTSSIELPPPSDLDAIGEYRRTEVRNEWTNSNTNSYKPVTKKDVRITTGSLNASDVGKELVPQTNESKIEPLGLAGFVSGLVGLFAFGIPLGIVATVFGGVGLSKIKKNPEKFSGKGFALASLIIGIVDIAAVVILLLLL